MWFDGGRNEDKTNVVWAAAGMAGAIAAQIPAISKLAQDLVAMRPPMEGSPFYEGNKFV
jgi:hypothetical protein